MIRARPAIPADADAIARIHVAAWDESYRGLLPDSVIDSRSIEMRREQWRSGLAMSNADPTVVVALGENDAPIGFGAAGRARDAALEADAEIYAIYILESAKRRGAGRMIFEHLFAAMVARGHRSIGLW